MSAAQRLILVLLTLAVVATFGVLAWLVFGAAPAQPAPTPTPAATGPAAPTAAPTAAATPTPPATPAEPIIPPPTKPADTPAEPARPPDWLGVGDFDGDARPDLAVVSGQGLSLSLLAGSGQGWNGQASDLPRLLRRRLTGRPVAFAVADLDGDRTADLALGLAGAPSEQGVLVVWGKAPWPAQFVVLPQTPLALTSACVAGHSTLYALMASGLQPIAVGANRQLGLLPFMTAAVRSEGSAQAGAVRLTSADGAAYICFVTESAGGGPALTAHSPGALQAQSFATWVRLDAVPRALLAGPAGAELWVWSGERVQRGRPGARTTLTWEGEIILPSAVDAIWPARLGPEQTPGVLTLDRERTTVSWRPWPGASAPAARPLPAMAGVISALTIGDADADQRDDLIVAIVDQSGEARFVTRLAATYPW
jgi:hypothetical protein